MPTDYIPETVIAAAVRTILATRDFCGNEYSAIVDFCAAHGVTDRATVRKLYRIARYRANAEWNQCQRDAGVPEKYLF